MTSAPSTLRHVSVSRTDARRRTGDHDRSTREATGHDRDAPIAAARDRRRLSALGIETGDDPARSRRMRRRHPGIEHERERPHRALANADSYLGLGVDMNPVGGDERIDEMRVASSEETDAQTGHPCTATGTGPVDGDRPTFGRRHDVRRREIRVQQRLGQVSVVLQLAEARPRVARARPSRGGFHIGHPCPPLHERWCHPPAGRAPSGRAVVCTRPVRSPSAANIRTDRSGRPLTPSTNVVTSTWRPSASVDTGSSTATRSAGKSRSAIHRRTATSPSTAARTRSSGNTALERGPWSTRSTRKTLPPGSISVVEVMPIPYRSAR